MKTGKELLTGGSSRFKDAQRWVKSYIEETVNYEPFEHPAGPPPDPRMHESYMEEYLQRIERYKEYEANQKTIDPNYYVHPKYWYKTPSGACGQGRVYAEETYRRRQWERRKEQEAKLQEKFPFVTGLIVTRYVAQDIALTVGYGIGAQSWDIKDKFYTVIEKPFNFLISKPVNTLRDIGKQK